MHWMMTAAIAFAALAVSSANASADCVDDWEDRTVTANGTVLDVGEDDFGWWILIDLETNDGCLVEEIFGFGDLPPCEADDRFEVAGHFHYDEDNDYHFDLWLDDILAIHADSITCR